MKNIIHFLFVITVVEALSKIGGSSLSIIGHTVAV